MFGWVAVLINHRMMAISGHMIELIVESDAALCSELSVISLLQFIASLWLAGHSKCTQWNTWGGFQRFHSLNDRNFQHLKIFFPLVTKCFCLYLSFFFCIQVSNPLLHFHIRTEQGYVPQGLVSRIRLDFYLNCHFGSYEIIWLLQLQYKRTLFWALVPRGSYR